jgi:hypothetical protein
MEESVPEPVLQVGITEDLRQGGVTSVIDLFEETGEAPLPQQLPMSTEEESNGAKAVAVQLHAEPGPDSSQPEPEEPEHRSRIRDPSLIERYTKDLGYQWNEEKNRYVHRNGSWFQHGEEGFNWELFSRNGEIMSRFWVSSQCLETKGIEINAEIWELIKQNPTTTAMVIQDESGRPCAFTGDEMLALMQNEEVILYQAKYRLRRKL